MSLVKKCRHVRAGKDPRRCRCTWLGDITVAGKRTYYRLGPNLAVARREHERIVREARGGGVPAPGPAAGESSFSAVAERWWNQKEPRLAPNTARSYESSLAHARRYFTDGDVRAITAADLSELEGGLLRLRLKPGTVRHVRKITRQVLLFARDEGLLTEVPGRAENLPGTQQEPRVLAPADMQRVLTNLESPFQALSRFTWLTAMRPGEAIAVQWGDVEGSVLHVRRNRIQRTGQLGPTKSRRARQVDLSPNALVCLPPALEQRADDFIFPVSYSPWLRAWHDAVAEAGLERCGLHTLRHSGIALRLIAGQTLPYIARQVGHANSAFTLSVYGRWVPSLRDDPALLDAAISEHG